MKKLLAILAFTCAAVAQGAILTVPGDAVTTTATVGGVTVTIPVAKATVTWCTYQGSGVPCSPAATVYASQTLTGTPTTNVGTTNAQGIPLYDGQQNIYAAAGTYVVTETGSGITPSTFIETVGPQCTAAVAGCAPVIDKLTAASPAIAPTGIAGVAIAEGYGGLAAAVTQIGETPTILSCSTAQTLAASLTIPANITLAPKPGCVITLGDFNLTLALPPLAGYFQIFNQSGSGSVSISTPDSSVLPEWWGARGDGSTDDSAAIKAAAASIGAGGFVTFRAATYLAHGLTIPQGVTFWGSGSGAYGSPATLLKTVDGSLFVGPSGSLYNAAWEDMSVESGSGGGHIFDFTATTAAVRLRFSHVNFVQSNAAYAAIYAPDVEWDECTIDGFELGYVAGNTVPPIDIVGQPQLSVIENGIIHGPDSATGTYALWIEASCGGCEAQGMQLNNLTFEQPASGAVNLLSLQSVTISGGGVYDVEVDPGNPMYHVGESSATGSIASAGVHFLGTYSNADLGGSSSTPDLALDNGAGDVSVTTSGLRVIGGVGSSVAQVLLQNPSSPVTLQNAVSLTADSASLNFGTTSASGHSYEFLNGAPGSDDGYLAIEADSTPVGSIHDSTFGWGGSITSPKFTVDSSGSVSAGSITSTGTVNAPTLEQGGAGVAVLTGALFTGGISAPTVTNSCSGVSAAMTAGIVTVSASCITGSRPISLVEATKGGTQGFLSYTQSSGSLVITSSSSTDTSTVSWVQN